MAQWVNALDCSAGIPNGHRFETLLLHSDLGLCCSLEKQWRMTQVLGPQYSHVSPGGSSWILTADRHSLAMVAMWGVYQQKEDLSLSLCFSLSLCVCVTFK